MNAYPNSNRDVIEVENFKINGKFSIFDSTGKKIDSVPYLLRSNGIQLEIRDLATGIYYLRTDNDYLLFIKN